jgi:phosphotriesterase-related protein
VLTGAPVTVHTHPGTRNGLDVLRVLRSEGAELRRVVIGHSGDSTDPDYLAEVADAGCLLGMDRFGRDSAPTADQRAGVIAELCRRGYADRIVLSHDAACYIDWFPYDAARAGNYTFIHEVVLPALAERGVTTDQIDAMLVGNPRRYFTPV